MSGSATFEIIAKPISGVTISDNDQSKTYDGQAAALDLDALSISGTDTVSGIALSDTGIQASDFDWYYAMVISLMKFQIMWALTKLV